MTNETSVARFGGKGLTLGIIIAAIVTAVGIGLWAWQMSQGLVVTNMRDLDSWGLYITNFMFLVGLSAGGLIISSAPRVFGVEGFGGISKIAVWTSICCTVLAIGFVIIDMGHPLRIWELFAYSNLGSPLMWDIVVLAVYLIVSIIYLWATLRVEKGKGSQVALRVLSVVALVTAILVHSVTAWIFGLQQAHEFWYTALLAPWFVSSALVCGIALVIAVAVGLRSAGYMALDQKYVIKMVKLLGVFLCIDLYFFACDLLTAGFPEAGGADVVAMLTSGPLALYFWMEIILSIIAILIAFTPQLRKTPIIVAASLCAIIAIFCKRVQLLVGGFQIANLEPVGVMTPGSSVDWISGLGIYQQIIYTPTMLELGVSLGVVGLGALMLLLGLKFLPLKPKDAME